MAKRCIVCRTYCIVFVCFFITKSVSFGRSSFSNSNSENNSNIEGQQLLIIARIETQENTNELFKYAKYITGFCRKKKKQKKNKKLSEGKGGEVKRSVQGER